MRQQANFARTDLGDGSSLFLEVQLTPGTEVWTRFNVVQTVVSWANNEIPEAQCVLAVGRRTSSVQAQKLAESHLYADNLLQSVKARIQFHPKGKASPRGIKLWPDREVTIFDGYISGVSPSRSNGHTQMTVVLAHYLVDMTRSSTISGRSHPSNPFSLIEPAVYKTVPGSGSGFGAGLSDVDSLTGVAERTLTEDWWTSVKAMLWFLASVDTSPFGNRARCGSDPGVRARNTRALSALKRIESGESPITDLASARAKAFPKLAEKQFPASFKYGRKLRFLTNNVPTVNQAAARSVSKQLVSSFANTTMWDKLVGELMPEYGLAIAPTCGDAIVFADTPTARIVEPWRTIYPDEFISLDWTARTLNPLAGVAIHSKIVSSTGWAKTGATVQPENIAGCYWTGNLDGVIRVTGPPSWLQHLFTTARGGENTLRTSAVAPALSAVLPSVAIVAAKSTDFSQEAASGKVETLFDNYARHLFVKDQLQGRIGSLTGRLRFDIAPGSIVRIVSVGDTFRSRETTNNGVETYYACVSRVTTSISSEGMSASTTFQLTHIRSEAENSDNTGTDKVKKSLSTPDHPLFGKAFHGNGTHGAPLLDDYP